MWIISRAADAGFRLKRISAFGGIAVAAAACSPVRVGVVQGDSMRPALNPGQPFLYQPLNALRTPVGHGEVLVFRRRGALCIKRVLAVAGERFWALGRRGEGLAGSRILTVDTPPGPWIRRFPRFSSRPVDVPPGHLFVIGDHQTSMDSRHYGPIPAASVVGRVVRPGEDRSAALSGVAWSRLPPTPRETAAWMAGLGYVSTRPASSSKSSAWSGGVLPAERAAGRREPRARPWSYGARSSSARSRRVRA